MSNSLKFTNKEGCITVKIEILNQQLIAKKNHKVDSTTSICSILKDNKNKKISSNNLISIFRGNDNRGGKPGAESSNDVKLGDSQLNKTIENDFYKHHSPKHNSMVDKVENGQERYVNIKISVIDSGIGISNEGLKKLFIDFGKLDENSKRNS